MTVFSAFYRLVPAASCFLGPSPAHPPPYLLSFHICHTGAKARRIAGGHGAQLPLPALEAVAVALAESVEPDGVYGPSLAAADLASLALASSDCCLAAAAGFQALASQLGDEALCHSDAHAGPLAELPRRLGWPLCRRLVGAPTALGVAKLCEAAGVLGTRVSGTKAVVALGIITRLGLERPVAAPARVVLARAVERRGLPPDYWRGGGGGGEPPCECAPELRLLVERLGDRRVRQAAGAALPHEAFESLAAMRAHLARGLGIDSLAALLALVEAAEAAAAAPRAARGAARTGIAAPPPQPFSQAQAQPPEPLQPPESSCSAVSSDAGAEQHAAEALVVEAGAAAAPTAEAIAAESRVFEARVAAMAAAAWHRASATLLAAAEPLRCAAAEHTRLHGQRACVGCGGTATDECPNVSWRLDAANLCVLILILLLAPSLTPTLPPQHHAPSWARNNAHSVLLRALLRAGGGRHAALPAPQLRPALHVPSAAVPAAAASVAAAAAVGGAGWHQRGAAPLRRPLGPAPAQFRRCH